MKNKAFTKCPGIGNGVFYFSNKWIGLLIIIFSIKANCQPLPKALIITGNGNVPTYKNGYPPWIHEFQNEKVVDILRGVATVDVSDDLNMLQADRLKHYDRANRKWGYSLYELKTYQ